MSGSMLSAHWKSAVSYFSAVISQKQEALLTPLAAMPSSYSWKKVVIWEAGYIPKKSQKRALSILPERDKSQQANKKQNSLKYSTKSIITF